MLKRIGKNRYFYRGYVITMNPLGYYTLIRQGKVLVTTPKMTVGAAMAAVDNLNRIK